MPPLTHYHQWVEVRLLGSTGKGVYFKGCCCFINTCSTPHSKPSHIQRYLQLQKTQIILIASSVMLFRIYSPLKWEGNRIYLDLQSIQTWETYISRTSNYQNLGKWPTIMTTHQHDAIYIASLSSVLILCYTLTESVCTEQYRYHIITSNQCSGHNKSEATDLNTLWPTKTYGDTALTSFICEYS